MSSRKRRNKGASPEVESHFVQLAEWLALESRAEVARMTERRRRGRDEDAEKTGESILDLVITDHSPGLGGTTLVTFQRRNQQLPMPWHRLKVGSPVVVSDFPGADDRPETGVVSRQQNDRIQVALNRWPEGDRFRIDLTADEVTRQRQLAAIMTAKDSRGRLGQIRAVLLGEREPEFGPVPEIDFHLQLNPSQQDAVRFGLTAHDLAIIHGPPGTGKTTTVVELIIQAIRRGDKVLACAPSNTAVDNLLERLIEAGQRVVRLGHPARVAERLRDHSLDGLVESHENMPVIKDMLREAEGIFRKADKWTRAKPVRGQRQEMRREAKRLIGDARMLERQAIESILDRAHVVAATTTFNESLLGDRWFDLAVIDEACQSTEPGCWVPLLRADKLILAGDHFQLPPTVLSEQAAREGFAVSLMERLMKSLGTEASRLLTVQYRMHQQIMVFSSQQFYQDKLVAHPTVEHHRLMDLEHVAASDRTRTPVRLIDTAGAGWDEELEPDGESKRNPREASWVINTLELLIGDGVWARDIAVIGPYAAQVRLIRSMLLEKINSGNSPLAMRDFRDLEIDTVDGFQGREKEAVIISLVRSNPNNEIGFLADTRRMNVALTRARRSLQVIGDSATLGGHEFYADFFQYIESIGAYQSVWELDEA